MRRLVVATVVAALFFATGSASALADRSQTSPAYEQLLNDHAATVLRAVVANPASWSAYMAHDGQLNDLLTGNAPGMTLASGQAFGQAWVEQLHQGQVLHRGDRMPVFLVRHDGRIIKVGIAHPDSSITVLTFLRQEAPDTYWKWRWVLSDTTVVQGR